MRQSTVKIQEFYPSASGSDSNLKSLARAILAQAFWDALALPRRKNEDLRDDAVEWFSSSEQTPGSLHWICSILHIDSARLGQWVRSHKRNDRDAARKIRILLRPISI